MVGNLTPEESAGIDSSTGNQSFSGTAGTTAPEPVTIGVDSVGLPAPAPAEIDPNLHPFSNRMSRNGDFEANALLPNELFDSPEILPTGSPQFPSDDRKEAEKGTNRYTGADATGQPIPDQDTGPSPFVERGMMEDQAYIDSLVQSILGGTDTSEDLGPSVSSEAVTEPTPEESNVPLTEEVQVEAAAVAPEVGEAPTTQEGSGLTQQPDPVGESSEEVHSVDPMPWKSGDQVMREDNSIGTLPKDVVSKELLGVPTGEPEHPALKDLGIGGPMPPPMVIRNGVLAPMDGKSATTQPDLIGVSTREAVNIMLGSNPDSEEYKLAYKSIRAEYQNFVMGNVTKLGPVFDTIAYIAGPYLATANTIMQGFAENGGTGSFWGDIWDGIASTPGRWAHHSAAWSRPPEFFLSEKDAARKKALGETMGSNGEFGYSSVIVEKYFPNVPEKWKWSVALGVEFASDPLIVSSMSKAMVGTFREVLQDYATRSTGSYYTKPPGGPFSEATKRLFKMNPEYYENIELSKKLFARARHIDRTGNAHEAQEFLADINELPNISDIPDNVLMANVTKHLNLGGADLFDLPIVNQSVDSSGKILPDLLNSRTMEYARDLHINWNLGNILEVTAAGEQGVAIAADNMSKVLSGQIKTLVEQDPSVTAKTSFPLTLSGDITLGKPISDIDYEATEKYIDSAPSGEVNLYVTNPMSSNPIYSNNIKDAVPDLRTGMIKHITVDKQLADSAKIAGQEGKFESSIGLPASHKYTDHAGVPVVQATPILDGSGLHLVNETTPKPAAVFVNLDRMKIDPDWEGLPAWTEKVATTLENVKSGSRTSENVGHGQIGPNLNETEIDVFVQKYVQMLDSANTKVTPEVLSDMGKFETLFKKKFSNSFRLAGEDIDGFLELFRRRQEVVKRTDNRINGLSTPVKSKSIERQIHDIRADLDPDVPVYGVTRENGGKITNIHGVPSLDSRNINKGDPSFSPGIVESGRATDVFTKPENIPEDAFIRGYSTKNAGKSTNSLEAGSAIGKSESGSPMWDEDVVAMFPTKNMDPAHFLTSVNQSRLSQAARLAQSNHDLSVLTGKSVKFDDYEYTQTIIMMLNSTSGEIRNLTLLINDGNLSQQARDAAMIAYAEMNEVNSLINDLVTVDGTKHGTLLQMQNLKENYIASILCGRNK